MNHLADWRGLPGGPGAHRQVLLVRPAVAPRGVGVGVAEPLQDSVHRKESNDGEAGREPFPDDGGGAVAGLQGVRQEVHQGVPHQGAHGQGHEQLEGGLLVSSRQHGDDSDCEETHQRDDGDGGEGGQPRGGGDGAQPGGQSPLVPLQGVAKVLVLITV